MKRAFAVIAFAAVAALASSGCTSPSPVRSWFAAERTTLTSKPIPAGPIFVEVLGGGDLAAEIENEIARRFRKSKYLKRGSASDSRLYLEVEPLDAYFDLDAPTFGPDVIWTTIVFRATLWEHGVEKPLLDGVVAQYKGYEEREYEKLLKPGLRRAAVIDGVGKLVGLIETNVPKTEPEPKEPAGAATGKGSPH